MVKTSLKLWLTAATLTGVALCGAALAQDSVTVVSQPPTSAPNTHYAMNRAPLLPSPLIKLPIGSITPRGWLRKQLELEADGYTGHLIELSDFCKKKNNAWLSSRGEGNNGWEEVPYWLRGFAALGYVLDDQRIITEAKEWLEASIASQREDGYFGPISNLKEKGDHDMMPHMSMMFALRSYHEYTGDPRVITLLTKYFKWQLQIPDNLFFSGGWQVPRTGDNLDSVYWLYNRTGEPFLLELADKVRRCGTTWMKVPNSCHNVDFSMGFRKPAQAYLLSKDTNCLAQAERNFAGIYDIYGQVPGGMFAGDEFARPGFTDPRNAIETCGIADMMLSEEIMLAISGDLKWADRCENAAYNSLPASMTADMKALHYLTSVNQIACDRRNRSPELADGGDMLSMNPYSHRCCQHNSGMAWPFFAESVWQATPGNGLAAIFYSPSEVHAKVGSNGEAVTLTETTLYPFDGKINVAVDCAKPVCFPLYLRVPGWCSKPQVAINGKDVAVNGQPGTFIRIERTWSKGDALAINLPMTVTVTRWEKNKNSASVNRGPLSFSVKIGEDYRKYGNTKWAAWEIMPTTPWNYGLVFDAANPAASFEVVTKPWPETSPIFSHEGTPVEIKAKARKIPNWIDIGMGMPGKLQPSPIKSSEPTETITLIPMGAARLRIASFPVIGTGPDAREWSQSEIMPASYWPDVKSPDHLRDGRLPIPTAKGVDCFKWVGWAAYGAGDKGWVRQDFDKEETFVSSEIFWNERPENRLTSPTWWKLYYLAGAEWKEVEMLGPNGFESNRFTRVAFKPVKTKALKIEAQTRKGCSSGIYEWRSWAQAGALKKHTVVQNFGVDIIGDPNVKTANGCELAWHTDPTDPSTQLPKSWKLYAKQGDTWQEVPVTGTQPAKDAAHNDVVTFAPVKATAMRMDIFCEPGAWAGPREWKVHTLKPK